MLKARYYAVLAMFGPGQRGILDNVGDAPLGKASLKQLFLLKRCCARLESQFLEHTLVLSSRLDLTWVLRRGADCEQG